MVLRYSGVLSDKERVDAKLPLRCDKICNRAYDLRKSSAEAFVTQMKSAALENASEDGTL
jgi:hypothetical protein